MEIAAISICHGCQGATPVYNAMQYTFFYTLLSLYIAIYSAGHGQCQS